MSTKHANWDVENAIEFMRMKFKEKDWVWDFTFGSHQMTYLRMRLPRYD